MSAFSFIPINDLIRGLPPGALSSRTANNENNFLLGSFPTIVVYRKFLTNTRITITTKENEVSNIKMQ